MAAESFERKGVSRLRVSVKKVRAIAVWTWGASEDICAICQNHLDGCAPGIDFPGDDSGVVWGGCKHAFHLHCISDSLKTSELCPLCRRAWEWQGGS